MLIHPKLQKLVQGTIKEFIDPKAEVLSIETTPIHKGTQAVKLLRHSVQIKILDETSKLSLVSKHATRIERKVLTWLYAQKASVPFSLSTDDSPEVDERSLICIQDVDYQTDYRNINIKLLQSSEMSALSHIHISNFGRKKELSWLPEVDHLHIEKMICERWEPQWEAAKKNEEFIEVFGEYIPSVEAVASTIFKDIHYVINDENSRTLIHNDLNPGNVLVHKNTDVIFIDWEEAKYSSLFLDIPLRCSNSEQIKVYRELLAAQNIEFPEAYFNTMYAIASRYLGLKYMSWNLGAWASQSHAKEDLKKYLDMVVGDISEYEPHT